MPLPTIGQPAPWPDGISDQHGTTVQLAGHRGQWLLLYFYPKDDTPGCTIEACGFRDHLAEVGAVVYGASLDDAASHRAFLAKHTLPFSLLVDPGKTLATAYGVVPDGSAYPTRSSFLIAPDGRIARVWPKVKADGHWQEVRQAVQEEGAKGAPEQAEGSPAAADPAVADQAEVTMVWRSAALLERWLSG